MKIFTFILLALLSVSLNAQVLIINTTAGCNYYGGHPQSPAQTIVEDWASTNNLIVTIADENISYGGLVPGNYCLIVFNNTSGDEVINTQAEYNFLDQYTGTALTFHAGAGDTERINSNCNNIDTLYVTKFSGAALRNSGKHSTVKAKDVYRGNPHPVSDNMPPNMPATEEWYRLGPLVADAYWDPTNYPLWYTTEGFGMQNSLINVWQRVNSGVTTINCAFGHDNTISDTATYQYKVFTRALNYLWSLNSCATVFSINESIDSSAVIAYKEDSTMFSWFTMDGKSLGKSKEAPLKNVVLIRKAPFGILPQFKKIYAVD
jgi:hypothetical protein